MKIFLIFYVFFMILSSVHCYSYFEWLWCATILQIYILTASVKIWQITSFKFWLTNSKNTIAKTIYMKNLLWLLSIIISVVNNFLVVIKFSLLFTILLDHYLMCDYMKIKYKCSHIWYLVRTWCVIYLKTQQQCFFNVVAQYDFLTHLIWIMLTDFLIKKCWFHDCDKKHFFYSVKVYQILKRDW